MVLFHDVSAGVKLEVLVRGPRATYLLELRRSNSEAREGANRSLAVIADLIAQRSSRSRELAS